MLGIKIGLQEKSFRYWCAPCHILRVVERKQNKDKLLHVICFVTVQTKYKNHRIMFLKIT